MMRSAIFEGLKKEELAPLQLRYGQNVYSKGSRKGIVTSLLGIIKEPMFLLLMLATLLYFLLGEEDQGLLMGTAMLMVAAISVFQEAKSTRALAALKKIAAPRVQVIRDSIQQSIPSEDLVPGDIIVMGEGDRIPADATILQANDCSVNESIITGESIPVEKNDLPGSNTLFQGSTINAGMCYGKVTSTGNNTMLGRLGRTMESIPPVRSSLQLQIDRFVKIMAFFGLTAFFAIWLVNFLHTGNLAQSLLLGLTLAMSAIPEEIPVAFSSFMALGAYRMTRLGIIARQPQTIENLGRVSVICLDKTGTITENRMQVKFLYSGRTGLLEEWKEDVPAKNTDILWFARLACEANPFDTMEQAIVSAWSLQPGSRSYDQLQMIHEYPLEGRPPMMTHAYESKGTSYRQPIIAAKGAPERIVKICKMAPGAADTIRQQAADLAAAGYRVLGVSSVRGQDSIERDAGNPSPGNDRHFSWPEEQENFDWQFEGLLALYDPPKKNIRTVFDAWTRAGIGIKIISGDYTGTVLNIASQAGMNSPQPCLTGDEVTALSPAELQQKVQQVNIYTRMFPDAKLKVIEALKAGGNIVAMTGDGVNDGPALRAAHIGIAMGNRGTEIAREAAALVISDDGLDRITEAIRQGRTIHSNLKKATRYLISIHIPIILTASLPLLLGWRYPTLFSPIHVIFLELIMGPTCSVFYEREPVEKDIMLQHPRPGGERLFRGKELPLTLALGLTTALGLLGEYYWFMKNGYSLEYTRTVVFITLLIANVLLTFAGRSMRETWIRTIRYRNNLTPIVLSLSAAFLLFIYFAPVARRLFGLTPIGVLHAMTAAGVALLSIGWFELWKGYRATIRPRTDDAHS